MLIAPTEHKLIKLLKGQSHISPEIWGVDVLGDGCCYWGVQRKQFPEDFMASTRDGRLAREVALMQKLGAAFLVLEGDITDTRGWTEVGLRTYLRTISLMGIVVEVTPDLQRTADLCNEIADYFKADKKHGSVKERPKQIPKDSWGNHSRRAEQEYLLQGFGGIGMETAKKILDHFGRLPLTWDCTKKDMEAIPGLGPKTIEKLWSVLQK